jgi:hypothetical protein
MVVGDVQVALVDVTEGVAITDERALPVVVEEVPRYGNPV